MNKLSSISIFFATLFSFILTAQMTQAAPKFTLPTSNNLPGHSQWFTWVDNGTAVAEYWLYAGSTVKGNQFYNSGNIGTQKGKTITGLPTDGSTVYVTLWYRISGGTWLTLNRTMTAKDNGGGSKPSFTSPGAGGTLSGSSHRAQWSNNGSSIAEYWVYAGSSVGGSQYANSGSLGQSTSWTINGLPTNGSTVHLTLWYRTSAGGTWLKVNSTATASNRSPYFISPAAGSTLSGASHSARWSANGLSVNEWWVYAGSSAGDYDYYNSGSLGGQTISRITNLPTNGSTVHLTLWYRTASGGSWFKAESRVTASSGGGGDWLPPAPSGKTWVLDASKSSEFNGSSNSKVVGWYPMLGWGPHEYFPNGSNYTGDKGLQQANGAPQFYSMKSGHHWLNGQGQLVIRAVVDKSKPRNINGYRVETAYLQTGYPAAWDDDPNTDWADWAGTFVSPKAGPLYISAKVRTDKLQGYSTWFAFWLHSQTRAYNSRPVDGTEIDIVEIVKSKPDWAKKSFNTANHWNLTGGSQAQMFEKGHGNINFRPSTYVDVEDSGYHIWGVTWSTTKITCYVDGKKYYEFDNHIPSDPVDMMMMLTLEFAEKDTHWWANKGDGRIEGPSVDDPNNNKTVREMSRVLIDYVRVHRAQ